VAALFSCSAGERAWESDKLKHGVFFHYVLKGLGGEARDRDGEVTWDGLQTYVRKRVTQDVAGLLGGAVRQTPTLNAGELAGVSPVLLDLSDAQQVPAEENAYTSKTGGMKFVRIKAGTFTMGSSRAEQDDVAKKYFEGKRQSWMDGENAHEVALSQDFLLGIHEVTRGQFRKFVEDSGYKTEAETDGNGGWGYNAEKDNFEGPIYDSKKQEWGGTKTAYRWRQTGFPQSDDHPVVNVTWNDAVKFAAWLSKKDGREYRLPTEAEWEYACRGGSTSRYHFGDDEEELSKFGNVADASAKAKFSLLKDTIKSDDGYVFTAPVGNYKANKFGLYDMHGNAWEWCSDWYDDYPSGRVTDPKGPATGSYRVLRGGSWNDLAWYCRSAFRYGYVPSSRGSNLGFRLALVPSGR
jgi:formylglycine-generating enzyme required for sulfatase activity